ncbi:helix-turn-helix domain-containing protein [Arthrobacter sp. KBS0703]|uniref:helix-turn-helix domain-containing protein n=1 Tax=Arthrobacter sp. KBS0703 TaxID=1955698 RepID=UPI00098FF63A|nr:helix-turn-helix domain-containing protein [Arthrobacter sp. KBS0703]TSE15033.1 helix-turn-helix domain-containing protein [Arthrobacter sp. KBS0703]
MKVSARRRPSQARTHSPEDAAQSGGASLDVRLAALHLTFTAEDLIEALEDMQRNDSGADLPARDEAFWRAHSGIAPMPHAVARGSANNAAAQLLMDSSSLTAAEVAKKLHLSVSTVRRYGAQRKLYFYTAWGQLAFPIWQFTETGTRTLPGLERILSTLPADLHPQSVAGFFATPQQDLTINGEAVTAAVWLEEGGSEEPVLAMARALAAEH